MVEPVDFTEKKKNVKSQVIKGWFFKSFPGVFLIPVVPTNLQPL